MSASQQWGVWRVYGKSICAALVLVVAAAQAALSDSTISRIEWVQIITALVNALLVYLIPNVPQWPWAKTVLAAALAALQLATSLIVDGISSADVTALILAALMVAAPAAAPSQSLTQARPQPPDVPPPGPQPSGYAVDL